MNKEEALRLMQEMYDKQAISRESIIAWYTVYSHKLPRMHPERSEIDLIRTIALWMEVTNRGGTPSFPYNFKSEIQINLTSMNSGTTKERSNIWASGMVLLVVGFLAMFYQLLLGIGLVVSGGVLLYIGYKMAGGATNPELWRNEVKRVLEWINSQPLNCDISVIDGCDNLTTSVATKPKKATIAIIVIVIITGLIISGLDSYISNVNFKNNTKDNQNQLQTNDMLENEAKDTIPWDLPPLTYDMSRINIPDVGSIDIPNNMEVQNEAWRQSSEALLKETGVQTENSEDFIIQQKGLEKYCRIIVSTHVGQRGDYEKLSENFKATKEELALLSELGRRDHTEVLNKIPGMKILEWYPPRIETINGMTAIVFSYRRQLNDNSPVLVWEYQFQNYDRLHILTLSYRENETVIWKQLFEQCLQSFRITNIMN